jgi:phytoene dehydrogenase-like protein
MGKRVLIIGAGISGLSAGCYARMNGYEVQVHEAHTRPGGLCTAWKRGDYTIDSSVHWILGTRAGDELYAIWQELGVVQGLRMVDHDLFGSVVARDGRILRWYTDVDRLEQHLAELAPGDARASTRLCGLIRELARMPLLVSQAPELLGWSDNLWHLAHLRPYLQAFFDVADLTLGQIGAWFSDPFLRSAVANFIHDEQMPASALIFTLGPLFRRSAGYPIGGSLALARTIERRLLDLGGEVHYSSRVAQVMVLGGRAVGVQLENGEECAADHVIAACDLRATLFGLLDGSRVDPIHRQLLDSGRLYSPVVLVSYGVKEVPPGEVSCVGTSYELEQPLELAGRRRAFFAIKTSAHDPTLAPAGKLVVSTDGPTDWSYWEHLLEDRAAYEAAKEHLAQRCLQQIERRIPGFASRVEVKDVATPHTFQRYTGNWRGSYMTWILSSKFQRRYNHIPKSVPGLAGLRIASMWTNPPGGVMGGALVGRQVVQLLCDEDHRRFTTSVP